MWRGAENWLVPYLQHPKRSRFTQPTDVMLAVCDHFEPFHHRDKLGAMQRLSDWHDRFPKVCERFQDHDNHPPKHTFFYPIEQYDEDVIESIAQLCRQSGSEVEVHLHHENDTEEQLRQTLNQGLQDLSRHGLLATDNQETLWYGFIHGNWALDNSDPAGRGCGVQRELQILKESGCFADFTMPSAPHPTQTWTVNKIYYAVETEAAKSHDQGYQVCAPPSASDPAGSRPTADLRSRSNHLLLVQGPLGLNWKRRKWGFLPRLENADLTGFNPPSPDRLDIWLQNAIHVRHQPDWLFIKLHCHGAINPNREMLLGEAMNTFHKYLSEEWAPSSPFRLHYVSAREMVNIIHAAEDGCTGNPNAYRNYRYRSQIDFQPNALPA